MIFRAKATRVEGKGRRVKGCLGLKDFRVEGTYRHQQ